VNKQLLEPSAYNTIALEAVTQCGGALYYVVEKTYELCLAAVKQCGTTIQYVKNQSPEIYSTLALEAVKQHGLALCYVVAKTPEICLEAVKQQGMALCYVVAKTPEICLEAVKQNGLAITYVNEQTPELCLIAVKQNGMAIQYVKNQTHEICLEAVKQDGTSLQFVKNQTEQICLDNLGPKDQVTLKINEILLEAVKQNGLALQYVKNKTPQTYSTIALEAIKQNPLAMQYVDKQYQTAEMIKYFFKKNNGIVDYVNPSFINKVSIKYSDGSISTLSVNKQPKNTIKVTTYTESTLIETIKTPLSITDYILSRLSKHENIIVVDNLDKMLSCNTLYMIQNSDQLYEVYKVKKVSVVKKGWIYNSEDIESKSVKVATYELCIKQ